MLLDMYTSLCRYEGSVGRRRVMIDAICIKNAKKQHLCAYSTNRTHDLKGFQIAKGKASEETSQLIGV